MIKGVNLGNWLVLEKWMSPELFDGTTAEDETYLCKQLSEEAKRERLKVHRDSYITGRDFAYLAEKGIDVVRIPIPFFILGDFEPYVGCVEFLDKAFDWAEKYGIRAVRWTGQYPRARNLIRWSRRSYKDLLVNLCASLCRKQLKGRGVRSNDYFYGLIETGSLSAEVFRSILPRLKDGVTEIMCHPGYVGKDLHEAFQTMGTSSLVSH